jgi:hypothetical protein
MGAGSPSGSTAFLEHASEYNTRLSKYPNIFGAAGRIKIPVAFPAGP